jgi:hypothetical protein
VQPDGVMITGEPPCVAVADEGVSVGGGVGLLMVTVTVMPDCSHRHYPNRLRLGYRYPEP